MVPSILKPDMKSVVWAAIGFFALPAILKIVKR